jgi:rhamnose utilization protein RhaD (predicted bifunctional aldolase and dehydrogenase)
VAFRWPLSVRSDSINAMRDRWSDDDARAYREQFAAYGDDVALRVYTSRLIGSDPDLVLHGGGNTSVKTTMCDVFGAELQVLCVKGSGADLKDVEPPGLPAVELAPLLKLRRLQELGDEAMVRELRRRLLDPAAPNPSVEALLHAFVPHKFVDHTHADVATCSATTLSLCPGSCRDSRWPRPWPMPSRRRHTAREWCFCITGSSRSASRRERVTSA